MNSIAFAPSFCHPNYHKHRHAQKASTKTCFPTTDRGAMFYPERARFHPKRARFYPKHLAQPHDPSQQPCPFPWPCGKHAELRLGSISSGCAHSQGGSGAPTLAPRRLPRGVPVFPQRFPPRNAGQPRRRPSSSGEERPRAAAGGRQRRRLPQRPRVGARRGCGLPPSAIRKRRCSGPGRCRLRLTLRPAAPPWARCRRR